MSPKIPLNRTLAALRQPLAVIVLQAAACWPVWPWYVARIRDGSDEPWCVCAFAAAILLALRGEKGTQRIESFTLPVVLLLAYAGSTLFLPPIFSAAFAFVAVGSTLHYWRHGRFFDAGTWGLIVLATPLLASLQFYLGYPLRVLVGSLAAPLLQLSGLNVAAEGTLLNWGGRLVEIDASCSGVRMLWTGLFLACALAAAYRFTLRRATVCIVAAALGVIGANALRAAALFYLEAGILPFPDWAHSAVGLVVFALTALCILRSFNWLQESAA